MQYRIGVRCALCAFGGGGAVAGHGARAAGEGGAVLPLAQPAIVGHRDSGFSELIRESRAHAQTIRVAPPSLRRARTGHAQTCTAASFSPETMDLEATRVACSKANSFLPFSPLRSSSKKNKHELSVYSFPVVYSVFYGSAWQLLRMSGSFWE